MNIECCSTCSKGRKVKIDIVEGIRCFELNFRVGILDEKGVSFSDMTKPNSIVILDVDNFSCKFYEENKNV